jgi:sodium-dependent dicarboxylate transporter 2/3/5
MRWFQKEDEDGYRPPVEPLPLNGRKEIPIPFTTSATKLTSNSATLLMPMMAALAKVLGVHPYLLMVPATVSASCAFMLPVATPPNAIVIGSGKVSTGKFFREGVWLNLAGAILTTLAVLTIGRLVLPMW